MEVILIRHGQSEANARLTTALDANLTDLGRRQALATAEYLVSQPVLPDLASVDLFVSPFRRTLQTAAPLAEITGLKAHAYPDMCEYFSHRNEAYASFVGLTEQQIADEYPFVALDQVFSCHGAWWPDEPENLDAVYRRAERVRDKLYELYGDIDRQIVIVSHAEPIGRLIEALQRIPPNPGWPPWAENCGIARLLVGDPAKPADLIVMNDTAHLRERGLLSPVQPGVDASPAIIQPA